jgi:cell division transport system ATP-binding protein
MSTDAPTDPSPPAPQPSDPSESRARARAGAREARRSTGKRGDRRAGLRPGDGPMVIFDEVTKAYGPNAIGIDDLSLSIESGEFVFLVGASGSGKSTFIRLLIKEVDATKGTVWVGGRNVTGMRRGKVPYLRRAIGCVFQDYKLLPGRSVYDNVAYALQVTGENPRAIRRKVPEMLSLVGLSEKGSRLPTELSGGEQQRVSIARAFVNHPRLLIADEPTGNLDPETSIGIMQLLYRINRTGTTVIMATHDRDLVDKMQMRVIELQDGKLIRDQRQARYARAE